MCLFGFRKSFLCITPQSKAKGKKFPEVCELMYPQDILTPDFLELQLHSIYFPNITLSQSFSALGPNPECAFAMELLNPFK